MSIQEILQLIISIATLIELLFVAYKFFRDPNIKAAQTIAVMQQTCKIKHDNLDDDVKLIKENHLPHIEKDVRLIENKLTKIFTILEERLPPKQ